VEAGEWVCTVCNYLPKNTEVATAGIDYRYYIERAEKIIHNIQTEGKKRKIIINPNQLSLW
jgi:hypothetical protein